jgi:hypothetical protein
MPITCMKLSLGAIKHASELVYGSCSDRENVILDAQRLHRVHNGFRICVWSQIVYGTEAKHSMLNPAAILIL